MDDPERYSGKDGSLSVNGEFVTVDEYVLLKLRNCEIKKQNKMLREALSLVVDKIPMNQNIYGGGYMLLLSHDDCRIIKETLNISELN